MSYTIFCRAQTIPARININITEKNLNCSSKLIRSLEHVQLRVDLDYPNRAELSVEVQSSSGTPSKFIYPRRFDAVDEPKTYRNLVVTSVHFWGETVLGSWIVDVKDIDAGQRSGQYSVRYLIGECSTCSEECFALARLNLNRQSCVVLRETFVQLGKSFRGGATTPI